MKMNKSLFLFCLLWVIELISCAQNSMNTVLLEQVEEYAEAYPDSALHLLKQIEQPEKLHGKERADYALLLTQTLDKTYLDSLQSDSLIQFAVDYYKNTDDNVKAAKSYYYYGKIMVMKNRVSEAMEAYLNALIFLKDTEEHKLQGLIFEHIGYLNSGQGMHELSIGNYQNSIHYYTLADDSVGMVYGHRNVSREYLLQQKYDSADWYANKGLSILPDTTNRVKASLLQLLGLIAKEGNRYEQAIHYFTSAIMANKDANDVYRYYLSLGCVYMDLGRLDRAEKCFNHCREVEDVFISSGAYNYLYLLKKEEGNLAQALLYREKSDSILKVISNNEMRNQLLTLQKKYETDRLVMENRQIKLEKENQAYFYLVLVLVSAYVSARLIKKYKKSYLRNVEVLRRNEKLMEEYAYKISILEQAGEQERQIKKDAIGKLNRKILELGVENKNIRKCACVEALYVLSELKKGRLIIDNMSEVERLAVFEFLNLVHADFVSRIKAEYSLTKGELLLASLIKLGFSNEQLMIVFDCEKKSIYKSKQRLKTHLGLKKEDSLEQMIALY